MLLHLISNWDEWVSRRVDSFYFTGDDERQLHRQQSVDFKIPDPLWRPQLPLLEELGGYPVPLTFVRKWRLPQFSLRDESDNSLSLLQREESVRLGAGMLIALGSIAMGERVDDADPGQSRMPEPLRRLLYAIVADERTKSLRRCAGLEEPDRESEEEIAGRKSAATEEWRRALLGNETFMSLAYELAGGFVLMAVIPRTDESPRRTVKFSYDSFVQVPGRDPLRIWAGHLGRRMRRHGRDAVDPIEWNRSTTRQSMTSLPPDPRQRGRLVLSTLCEEAPEGLKPPAAAVASVLVTIEGPIEARDGSGSGRPNRRRRQAIRLRPSGAVVLDGLPPGAYEANIKGLSGFEAKTTRSSFTIAAGAVTRQHLRTRRTQISEPSTRAPMAIGASASIGKEILRGIGWRSKPLAIRVRAGEGGSYHCEFEAPPGLHVTRARLLSNLEGNTDGMVEDPRVDGADRPHDVDMVLQSAQRAHLYAKADGKRPSTGYAMLNLRPRSETIVRPAFITAVAVALVILFLAIWNPGIGEKGNLEVRWALVALLLGGPGALAAYVAQAVASRVTNAMLWGLRVLALVPTILSFAAAGVLALENGQQCLLLILFGSTVISCCLLGGTYYLAEHPREQGPTDYRQGEHYVSRYSAATFQEAAAGSVAAKGSAAAAYSTPQEDEPDAVRDRMLERIGGLTRSTRRAALRERSFGFWEVEVPPALYFDSAEAPAVFLGLPDRYGDDLRERVRVLVETFTLDGSSGSSSAG